MVVRLKKEKVSNAQNPFIQKLCTIIAFYLAISSIFPQMRIIPGYTVLMVLAMFLWVVFAAFAHPKFFTQLNIHKFFIFFFILYSVIVPYLFGNSTIGNRYLEQSMILIFYLIYKYNDTYGFNNSSKAIVKWSLPFVVFTSVVTLKGLINMPYLARSIKSSGEETMLLRSQGIGGYELIYFLVFINIILFFIIFNRKKFKLNFRNKIIVCILFILFNITVLYSNYFTALLMTIISFIIIMITKNRGVLGKIFLGVIGFLFLIFSKNIFVYITNLLIAMLGNGRTVERLIDLQLNIMNYGGGESIFLERMPTIKLSWDAFLHNPILGMVTKPITNDGSFLIGFGQHSYFIDTLALYGVFIGLINIFIILFPFFIAFKKNKTLYSLNKAMMISTVILLFMNNATTSIGFVVYFVYPVINDLLFMRMDNEERRIEEYRISSNRKCIEFLRENPS